MGGAEIGPGYDGPDISDFTAEELVCIRNFVGLLGDLGVNASFAIMAKDAPTGTHELVSESIGVAMSDVVSACGRREGVTTRPENVHTAAVSLRILLDLWPLELVLPSDFVIDAALQQKCLDKFFEDVRQKAARAAADAASD